MNEPKMEELGLRIGSNLRLVDKERKGIVIGKKEVEEALLNFNFCDVEKVLTAKKVHWDAFIDIFTSL
ncbi:hypothetical protein ACFX2B_040141 [Malus domestica]